MNAWGTLRQSSQRAVATLSISLLVAAGLAATASAEPTQSPASTPTTAAPTEPAPVTPQTTVSTASPTSTATSSPTSSPTTPPAPPAPAAPAAAAVSVTASSAGTVDIGVATSISGTVTGAPNAPITVQVLRDGRWIITAYGNADSNGRYVVPVVYGRNTVGTYRFRVFAAPSVGQRHFSPEVSLTRVAPAVSVTAATDASVAVGANATIRGTVTGAPNAEMTIQVVRDGRWVVTAYGKTDSAGRYSVPIVFGQNTPGTYRFRAFVTTAAGRQYFSPEVSLTRVAPAVTVTAATDGRLTVGANATIRGTVTGAPNAAMTIQVVRDGRWVVTAYGKADSAGRYSVPIVFGQNTPGTYRFRAFATTASGQRFFSPEASLTRLRLDSRCYTTGVVVCASKTDLKVYYLNNGKIIRTMDARFGGLAPDANGVMKMYDTREGVHYVTRKVRDEVSYAYNNTPMPFTVYFYKGQAFHYSYGFAANGWNGASHGCVNLRSWSDAEWLFNNTKVGHKVVIYK